MNIITAKNITDIGLTTLLSQGLTYLQQDLQRWQQFSKSARHATHADHGVFELMPIADDMYYTYKYVNGHPGNPTLGKSSIVATGMLADVATGYPLLLCDMTILTAIRTAATSAIAASYLSRQDAKILGIIGTGAQAEFQVEALRQVRDITTIRYYDRDSRAMEKFANNLANSGLELIACSSGAEAVQGADIITTCICEKKHIQLFSANDIAVGSKVFVNAIGGDCPGKTELDARLLEQSRIVVEYYEQTKVEGEVQQLESNTNGTLAYTELWELAQGVKPGRLDEDDCIVFDSVGFALADFSMMRMLYEMKLGVKYELLPEIEYPKNLIGVFEK